MTLEEFREGINIALNEATIRMDFDNEKDTVGLAILPITLDVSGAVPEDPRRVLLLLGVSRMAISSRLGHWGDDDAEVIRLDVAQLEEHLATFHVRPIYGGEFLDNDGASFARWERRLSLDYRSTEVREHRHTLDIFLEGDGTTLNARISFDRLVIFRVEPREPIPLEEFIADGKRGWGAVYGMDPAVAQFGIVPEDGMSAFSAQLFPSAGEPIKLDQRRGTLAQRAWRFAKEIVKALGGPKK